MKLLCTSFLIVLFCSFSYGQSQSKQITGFVYDNKSYERIPHAVIYKNDSPIGYSDSIGYFKIFTSEAVLKLSVRALGFREEKKILDISEAEITEVLFYLIPNPFELESVTIFGEKYKESYSNSYELKSGDIKNIPVFLEADALRALHTLPGTTSSNDLNGQVFLRGGNFDETAITLDGIPLYNSYHFGGIFGAVNPDIIEKERIYPSNYPIHYDDFLSGIIDIETKPGNTDRLKGIASVGLVSSKIFLEGPLLNGSFVLSARRTYFDLVSNLFQSAYDFPYYFYDVYGKYTLPLGDNHLFTASVFYSKDIYDAYYERKKVYDDETMNWRNLALKLSYIYLIDKSSSVSVSANYSGSFQNADTYAFGYYTNDHFDKLFMDNAFSHILFNTEFNHKGSGWETKLGLKINLYETDYTWDIDDQYYNISLEMNVEDILFDYAPSQYDSQKKEGNVKLYSVNTINVSKKLKTVVALGATYFPAQNIYFINPYTNLSYFLSNDIILKMSFGRYFQPVYTKRDKVNSTMFSPFAVYFIGDQKKEILTSSHYSVGITLIDLPFDARFEVEAFYKSRENIPTAIEREQEVLFYSGYACGVDILLKKETGKINGWVAYSFSRSVKNNNEYSFFAGYDRTHTIKTVLNVDLLDYWTISAFWTLASGLPFTPAAGKYFGVKEVEESYYNHFNMNRTWEVSYGRQNSARFSAYHRLDIGITGKFIWWEKIVVKPYLQVMNVYNSKNPFQYTPVAQNVNPVEGEERGSQILPTIGLIVEF